LALVATDDCEVFGDVLKQRKSQHNTMLALLFYKSG
jgi:hypothetical protein